MPREYDVNFLILFLNTERKAARDLGKLVLPDIRNVDKLSDSDIAVYEDMNIKYYAPFEEDIKIARKIMFMGFQSYFRAILRDKTQIKFSVLPQYDSYKDPTTQNLIYEGFSRFIVK